MKKIKINELNKEISNLMKVYKSEVEEGIQNLGVKISEEIVKELKETSPKRKIKGGGKYARGWTYSYVKGKLVIHNKTSYQLTHLLEFGHATPNGGRTSSKVHIRPAAEKAVERYFNGVKEVIKNGSK